MKISLKNRRGFTVAEMMIVVIILGILSGIAVNIYVSARYQYRFNQSFVDVVEMIQEARNYALSSRAVYDPSKIPPTFIPPDGYGVHIERSTTLGESTFTLFANTGSNANAFDADDFTERSFKLTNATQFFDLLNGSTSIPNGQATIIFKPPLAEASVFETNGTVINDLTLQFQRYNEPVSRKNIKFNRTSGFPEIEL